MSNNVKKGILSLIAGIGLIVLLLGIFTKIYSFNVGLIAALAIWIVGGALGTILGTKK